MLILVPDFLTIRVLLNIFIAETDAMREREGFILRQHGPSVGIWRPPQKWQLKGCPHKPCVPVSSCPNLSWYALMCPWPDLAATSHPWTSLCRLSSGRDFVHEVGSRPNST